ncbi:MAG: hypothetical protein K6A69_02590 [Lachnospiraceae bacterium]|nr:hypothetical protein [Lachnospiraceae bacterium]
MINKKRLQALSATIAIMLAFTGCAGTTKSAESEPESSAAASDTEVTVVTKDTMENTEDGGHVIVADGEEASYENIKVEKTGDAEGDEADFYGDNSAIFATNGATLTLKNMDIHTNGAHANAVFSYGEGTTVNISDSIIETEGNCSGGIMTTGGGTTNAENLSIHTTGNSSAAIRSDRGGGTVNVTGGDYTTEGTGSPVIYSTADITVSDATLESKASEGVVVEGKNSVTLNNSDLIASNTEKNSDKSSVYKAVMIYQSMSGDAAEGEASFTMNGGTLANANGDIFYVNNTVASINLKEAAIKNNDSEGAFLRAEAAGWGQEGSNGGKVILTAEKQVINGDIIVDDISGLNCFLKDGSSFSGSINSDGQAGDVYVELSGGSVWTLTADSYISALTCEADSIDLNGHKLYVNGSEYKEGEASEGEAFTFETAAQGGQGGKMGTPPDGEAPDGSGGPAGEMGTPPDGEAPDGNGGPAGNMGTPPDGGMGNPPDGNGGPGGGTPPEMPSN